MAERAKKLAAAKRKLKAYQKENQISLNCEEVAAEESSSPATQSNVSPEPLVSEVEPTGQTPMNSNNVDVIEMLISEKSQISGELAQYKILCKQKEQELDELQERFTSISQRANKLENTLIEQKRVYDELQELTGRQNEELLQLKIQISEKSDYIGELKNMLAAEKQKLIDLESKEHRNDVQEELRTVRSAEDGLDTRVESLMQTKYMYEQQIRDLQAIVQQLTQDKEQSNQQYQNYASHLNQEISSINEKNAELAEQVSSLEAREKSFIEHIGGLEKQIQQNLKLQQLQSQNKQEESSKYLDEIAELKSQLEAMNEEKMVFQLKIKSQEDKLQELINEKLQTPDEEIVEHLYSPDDDRKLLEKMESDKIAASRALIQNAELKQQLDELQMKFIELTNDKVELMTKLDSEIFSNKDIKQTYNQSKGIIDSLTEKLHYKDEEMIRLTHENNDLKLENMELMHGRKKRDEHHKDTICSCDHQYDSSSECQQNDLSPEHHHHHDYEMPSDQQHCSDSDCQSLQDHLLNGSSEPSDCLNKQGVQETNSSHSSSTSTLAPEAAMHKLEVRFTKLMSEVADLTDDKQRLEHLVLQLQGETETIGEYISLYQTQRRNLKQRDYERNNYLQKIESERQELLKKMDYLDTLLPKLGVELPHTENFETTEESPIEPMTNGLEDKQQVLQKIQAIIREMQDKSIIKDDLTKFGSGGGGSIAIDHCSFCSGNLETV